MFHEKQRRLFGRLAGLAAVVWAMIFSFATGSEIKTDEEVTFFPTLGARDPASGGWALTVHGWIYEPEHDSAKRQLIWKLLGQEGDETKFPLFKSRVAPFLVDNERGKTIGIRLQGVPYKLEKSEPNGHFAGDLRYGERSTPAGWLDFQAVTAAADKRKFAGRVLLVEPDGISVVSDIDDTIKISQVRDKKELLANTFLREFKPAPGMAAAYKAWQARGAAFHYVSASPWQLYAPLEAFRDKEGFPPGSFHMRQFRIWDSSALDFLASPAEYKPTVILALIDRYPQRRFILVGDSGEQDPEIYGEIARKRPDRVKRIFIRDVTQEPATAARYQKAFNGVAPHRWMIFDDGQKLLTYQP